MREIEALSTTCLCGGTLGVSEDDGLLVHSLPTCRDYDAVQTVGDAAELLERCRLRHDN